MITFKEINLTLGKNIILKDLNLKINKGSKFLLNQKSGSGKTTLIKCILGFIQPESGFISVNNQYITPKNITKIRKDIFYLDQDVTLPELEVNQLIKEILEYKSNKGLRISKKTIETLLHDFKLHPDILNKNVKNLSGGERQRLGLIIGFILNRHIWLLDEPTSALDKELKEIVKNKIENLPITALIISHDNCWKNLPTLKWSKNDK